MIKINKGRRFILLILLYNKKIIAYKLKATSLPKIKILFEWEDDRWVKKKKKDLL